MKVSLALTLWISCLFALPVHAMTRWSLPDEEPEPTIRYYQTVRPPRQGSGTAFLRDYQNPNYDQSFRLRSYSSAPGGIMAALARAASEGRGNLSRADSGPYCYRAVKQIIAAALGKNKACIRGILSNGSARNAGSDLERLGFVKDMGACNTQGVIRVYRGVVVPGTKVTKGDIHGDVQVLGDDGQFHHFLSNSRPSNETNPRRILTGCYVPNEARVTQVASVCPNAGGYGGFGGNGRAGGQ